MNTEKSRTRGFYREPTSTLANVEDADFSMPKRATRLAAGYDIYNNTGSDIVIPAKSTSAKISTGVVAYMLDDEYLKLHVRSGHGFKHSVRLANSTGIIDADYLQEIFIKIRNPNDYEIVLPAGEGIAQAIFTKFLLTDNDIPGPERHGGFGSTSK